MKLVSIRVANDKSQQSSSIEYAKGAYFGYAIYRHEGKLGVTNIQWLIANEIASALYKHSEPRWH